MELAVDLLFFSIAIVRFFMRNSSEINVVSGNVVENNRLGMHLGSSSNNTISTNHLINNTYNVVDDGKNRWD
jgi:parallel beta-helix repeat protein